MELPELTSSAGASPARTFPSLERVQALPANGRGYGQSSPVSLARYDRATQSWRTWQRCLVEGWAKYSETWPRSGMTRNGIAYQLPTLAHLTDATESGLWPTPSARDGKGARR